MGEKDVRGMVFRDFGSVKKAKRGYACIYKERGIIGDGRRGSWNAAFLALRKTGGNGGYKKSPQDCGDLRTGRGKH